MSQYHLPIQESLNGLRQRLADPSAERSVDRRVAALRREHGLPTNSEYQRHAQAFGDAVAKAHGRRSIEGAVDAAYKRIVQRRVDEKEERLLRQVMSTMITSFQEADDRNMAFGTPPLKKWVHPLLVAEYANRLELPESEYVAGLCLGLLHDNDEDTERAAHDIMAEALHANPCRTEAESARLLRRVDRGVSYLTRRGAFYPSEFRTLLNPFDEYEDRLFAMILKAGCDRATQNPLRPFADEKNLKEDIKSAFVGEILRQLRFEEGGEAAYLAESARKAELANQLSLYEETGRHAAKAARQLRERGRQRQVERNRQAVYEGMAEGVFDNVTPRQHGSRVGSADDLHGILGDLFALMINAGEVRDLARERGLDEQAYLHEVLSNAAVFTQQQDLGAGRVGEMVKDLRLRQKAMRRKLRNPAHVHEKAFALRKLLQASILDDQFQIYRLQLSEAPMRLGLEGWRA